MIQNSIATSRRTLPITSVYGLVLCAFCMSGNLPSWAGVALLALSTLMMVELNNANSLIRIYSRMVSCCFLVLTLMDISLIESLNGSIVQTLMIAAYVLLFRAYQDKHATGLTFFTFVCIGVASLFNIKILCYVPVLWVVMAINIMALSGKTFFASILGLILPYWFTAGYYVLMQQPMDILTHFEGLYTWDNLFEYECIETRQYIMFGFIVFLGIIGTIHFLRNSHHDKIRTRMMYELFIIMYLSTIVFIVLQPTQYDTLIRMLIINTSPLIAHFFALTKTRITNIAFCVISLAIIAITFLNIWIF